MAMGEKEGGIYSDGTVCILMVVVTMNLCICQYS